MNTIIRYIELDYPGLNRIEHMDPYLVQNFQLYQKQLK